MHNRTMCFLEIDCAKRNNDDFRSQTQEDHHLGQSLSLLWANFDIVNGVPLDYMHLVCLHVVNKLLCHKLCRLFITCLRQKLDKNVWL